MPVWKILLTQAKSYLHFKSITIFAFAIVHTTGAGIFLYLKLLGTDEMALLQQSSRFIMVPLSMGIVLIISLIIGFLEFTLFHRWSQYPLFRFIMYKYGLIVAIIFIGEIAGFILFENMAVPLPEVIEAIPDFIRSETFIAIFSYVLLFSIAFNTIRSIVEYLGYPALLDVLAGRYKQPREENLTFIFIDLKSSTGIAENLGHKKYSQFIDHCFLILTNCIYRHQATLYQFVGDEAVLFWKDQHAQKFSSPVELYFDFCRAIENESEIFLKKFGLVPKFRAAIHEGTVTATVIKSVRKSIVYHGDVLNICSRIMGLCSQFDIDLLVSGKVASWLKSNSKYTVTFAESVTLRGKKHQTGVYKVQASANPLQPKAF